MNRQKLDEAQEMIEETEGWLCHECAKKLDYVVEEKEITKRMIEKYKDYPAFKPLNAGPVLGDIIRWLDEDQS